MAVTFFGLQLHLFAPLLGLAVAVAVVVAVAVGSFLAQLTMVCFAIASVNSLSKVLLFNSITIFH